MSYISIIVPAFHLNTTDKNDICNYCCSQFNITQDNFSLIEFSNDQLKDNINYGIIFNESNLSLHKIEQLIYERNCIQNLSEKAFESLQLLSKKISDLENIINNIREEKKSCEKKYNKEIMKIENCFNCRACPKRCPYELNIPTLLQKNLADYKEILSGKIKV